MKKRFMCLLLALIMCLSLIPGTAALADGEENSDYYIVGTTLMHYNGSGGDIVIPDYITEISSGAFDGSDITSVVIPDSVTKVHARQWLTDGPFMNCKSLKTAVIGNGITELCDGMFIGCTSLESVTMSDNVEVIGKAAFAQCSSLSDINVPRSLREIHDFAFDKCTSLASFDFSESVKVSSQAFTDCTSLKPSFVPKSLLPDNVPNNQICFFGPFQISGGAIYSYSGSASHVDIPRGATGVRGFSNNTVAENLVSVTIPDSVTFIGNSAFKNCKKLTGITIPDSVTSIDQYAFENCEGLTDIVIPDSVTSIGLLAFRGCKNLKSFTFGSGLREIPGAIFCGNTGGPSFDSVTISEGTEVISASAFGGCTVKRVNIPVSVTEIGKWALGSVYDETEIYYAGTLAQWKQIKIADNTIADTWIIHTSDDKVSAGEFTVGFYVDIGLGAWTNAPYANPSYITATYNRPYGTLPEVVIPNDPAFSDIVIDGWYTERDGGERVTADTIVTKASRHTLYLHYHRAGDTDTPTVTLDANGGKVSPSTMTVTKGQPYGKLPTPTREGYTFEGWFTGVQYGTKITESTVVSQTYNHTLYARWTDGRQSAGADFYNGLPYRFTNSWTGFGYTGSYKIPYERYELIYGDTALARAYYNMNGGWFGNCFGMSSTSGMFFQQGNGINTTSFNANAKVPFDLRAGDKNASLNLTVRDFIEAMQVSQQRPEIHVARKNSINKLDELCKAVARVDETGGEPVIVCVMDSGGGHAVVGYDLQEISGSEDHLMVYDCNYSKAERYIKLTKNSSGYTGWSYGSYSSQNAGDYIYYIPYSTYYQVWQNRAGAQDTTMNLLTLSAANAEICDKSGNVVATVKNGELVTSRPDIYPMIEIGDTADGTASGDTELSVWLPSDMYTVKSTGSGELEASMVNVDQSVTVTTTADAVTFAVCDEYDMNYVQLGGSGGSYEIVLDSSLSNTYQDVKLSGTTGGKDELAFAQISGVLYAEGVDLDKGAELSVNGKNASADMVAENMPDVSVLLSQKLPFTDVASDAWYREAVQYVYARGLMNGISATQFGPDGTTSRAQIVTILYRLEGSPAVSASGFTDVPAGQWYSDAVSWASANGIVNGYGGGRFGPNDPITREQMASILFRYAAFKGYDVSARAELGGYADAGSISSYAMDAMAWANALGLISGIDSKTLAPTGTATRAQAAKILMSFCENAARS